MRYTQSRRFKTLLGIHKTFVFKKKKLQFFITLKNGFNFLLLKYLIHKIPNIHQLFLKSNKNIACRILVR